MRVRVGSIYWSKGGTEIQGVSIEQDYRGLQVLRINTDLIFNNQIQKLPLPIPGKALPVSSAVTLDWQTNQLHNRFFLKNWTSYPCTDYDIVGEIRNGFYFDEGAKSLVLVSKEKMLVGFLGNITFDDGELTYLFADLQCDTYPSWLYYAVDVYGDGSFRPIATDCDENKAILIYHGKNCVVPELIDDTSTTSIDDTAPTSIDDTPATSIDDTSTTSIDDTSATSIDDTSATSIPDDTSITSKKSIFDPIIFSTDAI